MLHASLEFGGLTILASDIISRPVGESSTGSGDAALSLDVSDDNEGKRIFDQLAAGGKINVNFQKQFWGAWHGNLVDKFRKALSNSGTVRRSVMDAPDDAWTGEGILSASEEPGNITHHFYFAYNITAGDLVRE